MFQKSDSVAALAAALSAAQGEMENATKNSTNPHFRSKYADLAEIINTIRPVLAKHGLAIVQFPGFHDGIATVVTTLTHASGEWMSGTSAAPVVKQDPQGVGSALTYLRRYSLAAVCGLAQEDDDGNGASKASTKKQAPRQEEPLLTDAQRKHLMAIYGGISRDERLQDANSHFRRVKPDCQLLKSFSEMTQRQAAWLIDQLSPKDVQ